MADNNGGSNTLLALIVGGLVVVVVLFFVFGGIPGHRAAPSGPSATISVNPGKG
jgi:hypothetical protein